MKQIYSVSFLLIFIFSFSQSEKLVFDYDTSGNQILREYQKENLTKSVAGQSLETLLKPAQDETYIYPNPVDTELTIKWNSSVSHLISKIELIPYNGTIIENIPFISSAGKSVVNMSNRLSGVYYIKIYLSNGRIINHSLIKN